MNNLSRRLRATRIIEIAILTAVYVAGGRAGLFLDPVSGFATLVWPPTAIALFALVTRGIWLWPGVAVGAFLVNTWVGAAPHVALGMALGNTLEAIAAAYVLERLDFHRALDRVRDVVALVGVAACASTAISATIGVASLRLGGLIGTSDLVSTWVTWWGGDLGADVLIAPILFTWNAKAPPTVWGKRPSKLEAAVLILSWIAASTFIFTGWDHPHVVSARRPLLLTPLWIWAAVRFGPRGAAASTCLVSLVAILTSALGQGPFVSATVYASLAQFQWFMGFMGITWLVLGASSAERAHELSLARESQLRQNAMLDAAPDAIVSIDRRGIVSEFNRCAEALFGFRRDEVIGRELIGLIVPEREREGRRKEVARLFADATGQLGRRGTFTSVRSDGTEFPAEVFAARVVLPDSEIYSAFIRDITTQLELEALRQRSQQELEQKIRERTAVLERVNDDLRRREEQLRDAQAQAHLGSFEWDAAENRLEWSDELYRIHGLVPGGSLTFEAFFTHVHPDDQLRVRTALESALARRQAFELEKRIVRADGAVRSLDVRGRVDVDPSGRAVRIVGTCQDVTEHKKAEAKFRSMVEAAPDAMVIVDRDGSIVLANTQAERLFGYRRAELLGRRVETLMPDRFRVRHASHREGFVREPRARPMGIGLPLFGRRKDGTEVPVEVSLAPLESEEGLLVSAAIRDTTERRIIEKRLRDSLNEKEMLLREIHHRVKSNLQVVASLLSLQETTVAPELRGALEDSRSRVQSMSLVHELLYGSKDLANIEFSEYLAKLVGRLVVSYATGQVTFDMETEPVRLHIDKSIPCGLIVNELVSNSLKHGFAGGRRGHLHVSLHRDDAGRLALAVTDDGVGIEDPSHIEPQVGLSIVQALVRQLSGSLEVVVNGGTTFRVVFPGDANPRA